ncbi:hypothetical protein RQP46_007322 [Phenoliferia psychrophenolica]
MKGYHASLLVLVPLLTSPALALFPAPHNLTAGTTPLKLSPSFEITLGSSFHKRPPSDLAAALKTTGSYLLTDQLEPLIIGRGESLRASVEKASSLHQLELNLVPGGVVRSLREEADMPYATRDEAYTLSIPSGGSLASISANSTLGLLRGLQTFAQLVYVLPKSNQTRFIQTTPLLIVDKPAFPHRGFSLDTSRNFFPVKDIERTLGAMGSAKLNTLHWHITDSQSWPLILPEYPELASKGAYSAAQTYTVADVEHVQAFAAQHGVSVYIEIDMPGHTAVIGEAYPQYIACKGLTPWATYANEPPAGQLRLDDEEVLGFAKNLTGTIAKLTSSPYFSTGGDEINVACYAQDPAMNASSVNLNDSISVFVEGLHATLSEIGKTPIVWEEMVLDHPVTNLSKLAVVLVWISSANVKAVVDKGFRVIHAASDYLYLDCGHGGWVGSYVGNSWCDPYKSWQKVYSFDPYANLTEAQQHLIVGGETLLWAEQADPSSLDGYLWPRSAAAAEVWWTGAGTTAGLRNATEALPRLHDWRYRAVQRGIGAVALQPEYCAVRPFECDLTA